MSLVGRTLSHYHVVEEISRGGMGIVYRATDTRLNRDVALKVLPAELTHDPGRRERFIREARAASALEHPNIAVIHDVGEDNGVSFIAMELIRGDKLSTAIHTGYIAQSPGRAFDIAVEITEALARAHAQGIVHRDLKPANVMLTEDGHAKVIDFGLAKLLAPLSGGDSNTATIGGTSPEVVLGTAAYMSPEQARGSTIDHRTDIFSFGILLYEMFSCALPFKGLGSLETMHAILHDPPPPLLLHGVVLPAGVVFELQRIVDKCLAKDPDARYQGMRDLVVDLKAVRRRLEAENISPSATQQPIASAAAGRRGPPSLLISAALIAIVALAGVSYYITQLPAPIAQATGTRPSVAVMYFDNNTGNQQLDWLRTGLTDMLVTDLSQSPDVEVLSTDRLVQILGSMNKLEDRQISFDTVQEVARRAGVKHVMLGSFIKSGDAIRINLKLQDAASGKILSTERVDAPNEANLFPTMDDLTRRLKAQFALPGSGTLSSLFAKPGSGPGLALDRDLKDVTTSSMEAYRYYAAGIGHHQRSRYDAALEQFKKAVAIDPNFALAYTKMAVASSNMGLSNERDQYAQRALALVDRLTPRERYYVEGFYYAARLETFSKAAEAYEKVLALYPDHSASRNNVALLYMQTEQVDKAIAHFNVLRERGFEFPGAAGNLAEAHLVAGHADEALAVAREYVSRYPDNEAGYANLARIEFATNRLDEADASLKKARDRRVDFPPAVAMQGHLALLRDDVAAARGFAQEQLRAPAANIRALGYFNAVYTDLLQGRTRDAVKALDSAISEQGKDGTVVGAIERSVLANIHRANGRLAQAIAESQRAIADARGRASVVDGLFAGAAAGDTAIATEYRRVVATLPECSDKYLPDLAEAIVAVEAGQHARARELLRGFRPHVPPGIIAPGTIVPVTQPGMLLAYWSGRAELAAGNDAEASAQFERIANAGYPRIYHPIEYVRSLYYLGQIADKKGDRAKAREYYGRFWDYWKDGDLDRDKVTEAQNKAR